MTSVTTVTNYPGKLNMRDVDASTFCEKEIPKACVGGTVLSQLFGAKYDSLCVLIGANETDVYVGSFQYRDDAETCMMENITQQGAQESNEKQCL